MSHEDSGGQQQETAAPPEAEDEQDPELAKALRLSREESGGDEAKDPAAMSVAELVEAREKAIEEEKQRFFDVRRHDSAPPPQAKLELNLANTT